MRGGSCTVSSELVRACCLQTWIELQMSMGPLPDRDKKTGDQIGPHSLTVVQMIVIAALSS